MRKDSTSLIQSAKSLKWVQNIVINTAVDHSVPNQLALRRMKQLGSVFILKYFLKKEESIMSHAINLVFIKIAECSYVISTGNSLGRGGSLKVPMELAHSRKRSCVIFDELPMLILRKSTTRLWQIWRNGRYGNGQSWKLLELGSTILG